jgi:DNA repair exonuclease SbcCD nuclease subunit
MRFLFLTDLHMSSQRLSCRKDDYPENILSKLKWVLEYAEANNIDRILHGGDFYHVTRISKTYENRVFSLMKQFKTPFTSTIGNHDVLFADHSTVERTPLGSLYAANIFSPSDWTKCVVDTDDTRIVMMPFFLDPVPFVIPPEGKKVILMAHFFLETGFAPREVLPPEMLREADYILLGHEHKNYPLQKIQRAMVVRPGAMSRGSRSENEWDRPIQVAVIDTTEDKVEYVEVPHLSSKEIFSEERYVREKQMKISRVIEDLSATVTTDGDVKSILDSMNLEPLLYERACYWLKEGAIL